MKIIHISAKNLRWETVSTRITDTLTAREAFKCCFKTFNLSVRAQKQNEAVSFVNEPEMLLDSSSFCRSLMISESHFKKSVFEGGEEKQLNMGSQENDGY